MQVHFDGCFKVKHSASAGRRGNAAELDAQVPSRIFMADAERDARDARIAANLNIVVDDASKTCNDFKADNADNGYASPLCILGWCARFLHALGPAHPVHRHFDQVSVFNDAGKAHPSMTSTACSGPFAITASSTRQHSSRRARIIDTA
jgi:hypothetical protein